MIDPSTNSKDFNDLDMLNTHSDFTVEKKELLRVQIDLGDSEQKQIIVNEGEDPHYIAIEFAKDNKLTEDAIPVLEQHIIQNIQMARK